MEGSVGRKGRPRFQSGGDDTGWERSDGVELESGGWLFSGPVSHCASDRTFSSGSS